MRVIVAIFIAASIVACASTQEEFSDVVKMKTAVAEKTLVASKALTALVPYEFGGITYQAEYTACALPAAKASWVLMNRDQAGFNHENFCQGWIAQAFLLEGYSVIGINRPSFGQSTGAGDFAGARSQKAIETVMATIGSKDETFKAIDGCWGYSSGAIAALFYAKKHPDIRRLALGGGIYDLEVVHKNTTDAFLKREIDSAVALQPDKAYEERSIAWDFQGLPKKLALYHGANDTVVPASQATSFRNSLAAQEFAVTFKLVSEASHELPWQQHQALIGELLKAP